MTNPALRERVAGAIAEAWTPGYLPDDKANVLAEAALEAVDGFDTLVSIAKRLLQYHYPADVFDGSSGDPGPVFVSRLREALDGLEGTHS